MRSICLFLLTAAGVFAQAPTVENAKPAIKPDTVVATINGKNPTDVMEAAVIAKPDERWSERPLCCVVLREKCDTSAEELLEHLRGRVARWWLPDEFAFVDEIPKTSVGKFDKKVLRERYRDHLT